MGFLDGIGSLVSGLGGSLLGSLGNIAGGIGNALTGAIGDIGGAGSTGFNTDTSTPQYGGVLKDTGTFGVSSDLTAFQPGTVNSALGDFDTKLSGNEFYSDSTFNPTSIKSSVGGLGGNGINDLVDIGKLTMSGIGLNDALKTSKLKRKSFTNTYNDTVDARNAEERRKAALRTAARGTGKKSPVRTTYHRI